MQKYPLIRLLIIFAFLNGVYRNTLYFSRMGIKTRFTTQTHRCCKEIIIKQKPTYGSKASFPFLINRMLLDRFDEYIRLNDDERHSMLTRIHYLSQHTKTILPFTDVRSMNIDFKEKASQIVAIVKTFNNKNGCFLEKDFVPNVIIMDYIKSIELRGEKFITFYINKHL